ncbi:uncharacterized protein [Physcomitrium patens]|uniref:Tetratricopeptide repeat protein 38 n=1 Tax=Physcomitrium patens TaxID=3218 RepID=A0A7I4F7Q0_PHYPA
MAEGVDGGSYTRSSSHHLLQQELSRISSNGVSPAVSMNMDDYRNDLWGYPVHTRSDTCISFINEFYRQMLTYGAEREVILKATDADGSCVLACALAAVHLLTQKKPDFETNSFLFAANKNLDKATNYEKSVLAVAMAWAKGETGEAVDLHFQLLEEFPKDLASLKKGQTLCFYMGRTHDMLRMAELVLPANRESPYIYGMLAFPLLEVGERMREAEVAAKKALSIEPHDVWSQHALGHVLQYECRFKEALTFAASCCDTWISCCSFMYAHNWWHLALCKLELGGKGALESVVTIYDTHIWSSNAAANNSQDCLNALGLLLRLDIRGYNDIVTTKIADMQTCLLDEQRWHTEWHQDLLMVWGLSRGDHKEVARKLLQNLKLRVENMKGEQQKPLWPVISLAEALYEYGVRNFGAVCDLLGLDSNLSKYKVMGASNEQLDVFQELWCVAFLRAGNPLPVVEVAEQRVLERSGIPFTWRLLAYSAVGQEAKANMASASVRKLEAAAEALES